MSGRPGVEFHDARRQAWEAASVLPTEDVPIVDAVGRMSVRDVVALTDIPHYASSAMDGWAVAGPPPWHLVARLSADGEAAGGEATGGEAVPIVTGGLVPTAADAVLRSEDGTLARGILTPSTVPPPGKHIRPSGEEARVGDVVIGSGTRLTPVQAAVAAGAGHDRLAVSRRPRVGFVFSGSEVVTGGLPEPGRVRDSFDPLLPAVFDGLGAITASRVRIGDARDDLMEAVTAAEVDLLVTTGGTSDSPVDHLRSVLDELGAERTVDGLAVRPGAPTLLARLPAGPLGLGLPGNPLAAMTGLLTLAPPIIARMHGVGVPPLDRVAVGEPLHGTPDRVTLLPYRISEGRAIPCSRTRSGMLRGLAEADGVLVIPADGAQVGDTVDALPLPW